MQEDDYDVQAEYYDSLVEPILCVLSAFQTGSLRDYLGLPDFQRLAAIVNWGSLNEKFLQTVTPIDAAFSFLFEEMAAAQFTIQEHYGNPYLWRTGYMCMLNLFDNQVYNVECPEEFEKFSFRMRIHQSKVDPTRLAELVNARADFVPEEYAPLPEYLDSDPGADLSPFAIVEPRDLMPEQDLAEMGPDYRARLMRYIAARGYPRVNEQNFVAGDLGSGEQDAAEKSYDGAIWSAVTPLLPALVCQSVSPVRALDIGGGDGFRANLVSDALHSVEVTSIDPSFKAGEYSRHYPSLDHRIAYVTQFDVVYFNMVLHHVTRIDRSFVQRAADQVQYGGYLVIREHNWDGSSYQRSFFDSLHHAHNCMGSPHSSSNPTRYFSAESLIRMFSRCGLTYCPSIDPLSNELHSGGGASCAAVLVFTKGKSSDYLESLHKLTLGVWQLHSLSSGETSVPRLENRLGFEPGTMRAYSLNCNTPCVPRDGVIVYDPISSTVAGRSLRAEFERRRVEKVKKSQDRVKAFVSARPQKECPKPSGPFSRVHDFAEVIKSRSDPTLLLSPSQQEVPDDAFLSQSDELTREAMKTLLAEEQRLYASTVGKPAHKEELDDMSAVTMDDFEEPDPNAFLEEFTPKRAPRETIKILVNRYPKKFALAVLHVPNFTFGIPAKVNEALKSYAFSERTGPSLTVVFWVAVILLRCVKNIPSTRGQIRNRCIDQGWCFDKQLVNSLLYGLYDIGWLLAPEGQGPIWTFSCPRARVSRLKEDIQALKLKKRDK